MTEVFVAKLSELPDGERRIVTHGDVEIGVFHWQGGFYAKHLSLRDRHMLRRLSSDVVRNIFGSPRRLLRGSRSARGDAVFGLGVATGAARWLLTERIRSRRA